MSTKAPLGLGVFLFGSLFIGLPTVVVAAWSWATLSRAGVKLLELTYAVAPGEVLSSAVESRTESDGDKGDWVKIAYRYTAAGRTYTGTRVESHPLPSTGPWARRYVAEHPPGTPVAVRFDPAHPETAVLEPGLDRTDPFFLLLLLLVDTYLALGWYSFWRWCFREQAGPTFTVRGKGSLRRVLLRRGTTWAVPLAVALFGMPAAYLLCFVTRMSGWMWPVILLAVLGQAVRLYRRRAAALREGRMDLVVDRQARSVTLPCTFGRRSPLELAFAAVGSVEVEERKHQGEDSEWYTYLPTLEWRDAEGQKRREVLADWEDQHLARKLAGWIRREVKGR
jgi:hypothetical protein